MTLQDAFLWGMKRTILPIRDNGPLTLNLGAGAQQLPGVASFDYPEWDASCMPIPYLEASVDTVLAFHLLEHLTGDQAIRLLRDIERVLRPGGHALIVVPHASQALAFEDLDHKSFYTEDTFKTLFTNAYYHKHRESPWRLAVEVSVIMGVAARNLAVFYQVVKV